MVLAKARTDGNRAPGTSPRLAMRPRISPIAASMRPTPLSLIAFTVLLQSPLQFLKIVMDRSWQRHCNSPIAGKMPDAPQRNIGQAMSKVRIRDTNEMQGVYR